jgi:hypothetical protein
MSFGEARMREPEERGTMLVIVPLWLAVLIVLITRPVYGLKMVAGFLLGGTIGLGLLALIVAA